VNVGRQFRPALNHPCVLCGPLGCCCQVLAQDPANATQHYVLPMPKWEGRESALLKRLAVRGPSPPRGGAVQQHVFALRACYCYYCCYQFCTQFKFRPVRRAGRQGLQVGVIPAAS